MAVETLDTGEAPAAALVQKVGMRQYAMVALLTLAAMLSSADRTSLSLVVTPLKQDLGISDLKISLLLGVSFSLLYGFFTLPAGYLVDLYSRKRIIAGSVFAWSVMEMMCGLAQSYGQLFVGRMGLGIGEAGAQPASISMIRDAFPLSSRARAFAIYHASPLIGGGLAMIIGGTLFALADRGVLATLPLIGGLRPWQVVLVAYGLLGLPVGLLLLAVHEPARRTRRPGEATPTYGEAIRHVVQEWRVYALLWGAGVSFNWGQGGVSGWLPTAISRGWNIPIPQIGHALGPIQMIAVPVGMFGCSVFMDRLSRRGRPDAAVQVGIIAITIAAASMAALPFIHDLRISAVFYASMIFFFGSYTVVMSMVMTQVAPARLLGKVVSFGWLLPMLLGTTWGPTFTAFIAETFFAGPMAIGDGMALNYVCFVLLGVILLLFLRRELRRRAGYAPPS